MRGGRQGGRKNENEGKMKRERAENVEEGM